MNRNLILFGFPLLLLITGCSTTHVLSCGDARLYVTHYHLQPLATPDASYRIELPAIDLSVVRTNHFEIRGNTSPALPDGLHMVLPQADHRENGDQANAQQLPWSEARITITCRLPEGSRLVKQTVRLGDLKWSYTKQNRIFGWHATANGVLVTDRLRDRQNYDVDVVVEIPSARAHDHLQIWGQMPPAIPVRQFQNKHS